MVDWDGSCGIVPLRKKENSWQVLLIQHKNYEQYWTFPKGHRELQETLERAACRELFEETGLKVVRFLQKEPVLEEFWMTRQGKPILKRILFFLAEVVGEVHLQKEEISHAEWFSLPQAMLQIIHPEGKATLQQAVRVVDP